MIAPRRWLRMAVLAGVAAAVVDQGCASRQPAPVHLIAGASVSATDADALERLIRDEGFEIVADAGPRALRVAVGLPREIVTAASAAPLVIAVKADARPHIERIGVPAAPVVGLALNIRAHVADIAIDDASLVVDVFDARSGRLVGSAPVMSSDEPATQPTRDNDDAATEADARVVSVQLLPLEAGPWPLCVRVGPADAANTSLPAHAIDACEHLELMVAPASISVDVLEARPAWAARFARLALTRSDDLVVSSTVRLAPAIAVQGMPAASADQPEQAAASPPGTIPDVTLVAGLDTLTAADVARLTRLVADEGRTVILLADGPLPPSRLGQLWPWRMGPVRTRATPAAIAIGPHRWSAREWLAPAAGETDASALAYLAASPSVPVVWGRALGAGRVVLVSALDTWRWRDDEEAGHDEAWQAFVLSIAGLARQDAPRAWRVPNGLQDDLQVSLPAAGLPDQHASSAPSRASGDGPEVVANGVRATMVRTDDGWRAVLPVPSDVAPVDLALRTGDTSAFADQHPLAPGTVTVPAGWADVERVVRAARGTVVPGADLVSALHAAAEGRDVAGPRWFITRQWWFAAGLIAALGWEWWLRRRAFLR